MNSSEEVFKQSENEVKSILVQKANDALKLLENERWFQTCLFRRIGIDKFCFVTSCSRVDIKQIHGFGT